MYRVKDVAGHFEVSVATIYRAIESGALDAVKLGSGRGTLRVTGAAVLVYAAACAPGAGEAGGGLVSGPVAAVDGVAR